MIVRSARHDAAARPAARGAGGAAAAGVALGALAAVVTIPATAVWLAGGGAWAVGPGAAARGAAAGAAAVARLDGGGAALTVPSAPAPPAIAPAVGATSPTTPGAASTGDPAEPAEPAAADAAANDPAANDTDRAAAPAVPPAAPSSDVSGAGIVSVVPADGAEQAWLEDDVAGTAGTEGTWLAVWQPFRSPVSAQGFAERLAQRTGLEFRVTREPKAGALHRVSVRLEPGVDAEAQLDYIAERSGLSGVAP